MTVPKYFLIDPKSQLVIDMYEDGEAALTVAWGMDPPAAVVPSNRAKFSSMAATTVSSSQYGAVLNAELHRATGSTPLMSDADMLAWWVKEIEPLRAPTPTSQGGQKIRAIKEVRNRFVCGLGEAKSFIDHAWVAIPLGVR